MKRDMDFINQLMTVMRDSEGVYFNIQQLAVMTDCDDLRKVQGHVNLCADAGYVHGVVYKSGHPSEYRLTWQGYDHLAEPILDPFRG